MPSTWYAKDDATIDGLHQAMADDLYDLFHQGVNVQARTFKINMCLPPQLFLRNCFVIVPRDHNPYSYPVSFATRSELQLWTRSMQQWLEPKEIGRGSVKHFIHRAVSGGPVFAIYAPPLYLVYIYVVPFFLVIPD